MINLGTIVSSVITSFKECKEFCVIVFWLHDDGDREKTWNELEKLLTGTRIIPHVLRQPIFRDPNAWAADAMAVVESIKSRVLQAEAAEPDSPLGLIVISRSKFCVAQSSSPAIAPQWLPEFGGRKINVLARDVQTIAACSLAADEASLPEIKSLLYQLELALLNVVKRMASQDRHHGQKLWNQLLRERSQVERRSEFVSCWANGIETITDPDSYRPSLTIGWSMVAAMWDTFLSASPSQLLTRCEAFVEFLGIEASWLSMEPEPSALLPIMFRGPEDHDMYADY